MHTSRVDQVAAAAQKALQLLQKGIVLGGNPGQGLAYKFTVLNAIKPDMITEATRNARAPLPIDSQLIPGARWVRFAPPTRVFSQFCLPTRRSDGAEGGCGADASLMKTVRVVTSVEYYLEK